MTKTPLLLVTPMIINLVLLAAYAAPETGKVKEVRIISHNSPKEIESISIGDRFRVEVIFQQAPKSKSVDVSVKTPEGCQLVSTKRQPNQPNLFRSQAIRVVHPGEQVNARPCSVRPKAPKLLLIQ